MSKLNVLFEDNHLLVCVKEPGVLSQEANKDLDDMLTLGKEYIKEKYQKPGNVFLGLVHRLDLNVGGIMVFARTSKAAARLAVAIQNHQFQKRYLAVVENKWNLEPSGELINYLRKDKKRYTSEENAKGQKAVLKYNVIQTLTFQKKDYTLVNVDLISGRFHQIRKQFSLINHPLVGDQKYGSLAQSITLPLWAYHLSFPHPITGEVIRFEHLPNDFPFNLFKQD